MKALSFLPLLVGIIWLAETSRAFADASLLQRGNAAFREENYEKAIGLYESSDSRDDYMTRKFNAGVSYLREGKRQEALERFEEVSANTEGDLQRSARSARWQQNKAAC